MKNLLSLTTFLFFALSLFAQSPNTFNYQAVVRNINGEVIANSTVGVQISILQGSENGFPVYMESFMPLTNDYGHITLEIGSGALVGGDFAGINWSDGPYFLNVEVDPDGGSNYTDLGSNPLVSVPYALHATTSDTAAYVEASLFAATAQHADTAAYAEAANYAVMAQYSDTAYYTDTAHYSDTADYANMAGNVFDGNYNSLSNTPDWNDTIDSRLDSAMFLTVAADSGNLVTYDGMNWIAKDIYIASNGNDVPISNIQPYIAMNYCIALTGIFPSRNWEPFIGTISIFGFNFAPRGWAQCNGQLLPISQNTALFSLVGTYYGGDGRTTFALPDLRGRVPINMGHGPGLSSYSIGQKGGSEQVTISIQNLPSHNHKIVFE